MRQSSSPRFPTALRRASRPNKVSYFVSMCVSSDNSFPSARQEPTLGPRGGFPSYNTTTPCHSSPTKPCGEVSCVPHFIDKEKGSQRWNNFSQHHSRGGAEIWASVCGHRPSCCPLLGQTHSLRVRNKSPGTLATRMLCLVKPLYYGIIWVYI